MPDPIDWNAPLETMRGEPVLEVLATDLTGRWSRAVKIRNEKGDVVVRTYDPGGRSWLADPKPHDLRNVRPAPAEHPGGWVNVYRVGVSRIWRTRAEADDDAKGAKPIACLRIPPFREGDGLGDAEPEPEPDRSQTGAGSEPGPGDRRNAVLEEAALMCEALAERELVNGFMGAALERRNCARAIRQMKDAPDA
jgi:hypothetical protein